MHIKSIILRAFAVIILVSGLTSSAYAAAAPATPQLKAAIDQFIQVIRDPDLRGQDTAARRNEKLHALFVEHFDQMEIARKALGRHWQDRTPQQQQDFARLFADLLERSYFGKIDDFIAEAVSFTSGSIQYTGENLRRGYAIVNTTVTISPESSIPVDYQLKQTDERWRICDIAIEGVSLLRNYRAQFDEIVKNYSFDELMRRLETKQNL